MQHFFQSEFFINSGLCATSSGKNTPYNFEIQSLQCLTETGSINTKYRLLGYEFFWIKNGKAALTIDLQQFSIQNKTMVAISPGQIRQPAEQAGIDGYYISLPPDYLYPAEVNFLSILSKYETVKKAVVAEIDETNQKEMEDMLLKMKKESTRNLVVGAEILKGLFRLFLLYLNRKCAGKLPTAEIGLDKCLVRKFSDLLCHHFKTKIMVVDYASEL